MDDMDVANTRQIGIITKSGMRHSSSVVVVRLLLQYLKRDVVEVKSWSAICEEHQHEAFEDGETGQSCTVGFLARAY